MDHYQKIGEQIVAINKAEAIDTDFILEVLEEMAAKDRRELKQRFRILIAHMLKWQYQQNRQISSWELTIKEQSTAITDLFEESMSLYNFSKTILDSMYERGKEQAALETNLQISVFPKESSYSLDLMTSRSKLNDWLNSFRRMDNK